MQKGGYVYIMANAPGGTLYIGVTSDIARRDYEHRNDLADGFSKKHQCHTLVYCEFHDDIESAIVREKQLKKWNRAWKLRLINQHNPEWKMLEIVY